MLVISFWRAWAWGTNSTLTSKSFCDWLKRWASDSTRAVRLGSGTLNWKRTGAEPQARRGLSRGSSHHARSAAAIAPVAAMVLSTCRRDRRDVPSMRISPKRAWAPGLSPAHAPPVSPSVTLRTTDLSLDHREIHSSGERHLGHDQAVVGADREGHALAGPVD